MDSTFSIHNLFRSNYLTSTAFHTSIITDIKVFIIIENMMSKAHSPCIQTTKNSNNIYIQKQSNLTYHKKTFDVLRQVEFQFNYIYTSGIKLYNLYHT